MRCTVGFVCVGALSAVLICLTTEAVMDRSVVEGFNLILPCYNGSFSNRPSNKESYKWSINNSISQDNHSLLFDDTREKLVIHGEAKYNLSLITCSVVNTSEIYSYRIYVKKPPIIHLNESFHSGCLGKRVMIPFWVEKYDYLHSEILVYLNSTLVPASLWLYSDADHLFIIHSEHSMSVVGEWLIVVHYEGVEVHGNLTLDMKNCCCNVDIKLKKHCNHSSSQLMVQLKNFKLSDEAGIYVDDRLQLFDSKSLINNNNNSVIIPVNSTGMVTVVVRDHSNNHSTGASVYMNTTECSGASYARGACSHVAFLVSLVFSVLSCMH
ncbi:uncharacterized protein LOC134177326 [Corticium candelabrum]|uniref:uncharacterized protein LOC134177326 n=1 Tax=Corticium candelabrum TaxID=121492 RepID=UPI002E2647F8|nr:uncharacterized protein LOC134177326 [Corticium candelabrum]